MAQQLGALTTAIKDLGPFSSTHMLAYNHQNTHTHEN